MPQICPRCGFYEHKFHDCDGNIAERKRRDEQSATAPVESPSTGSVELSGDDLLRILDEAKPSFAEYRSMTIERIKDGIEAYYPTEFLRRLIETAIRQND